MQREVATTDGWMVAMLRIYCEFIAMLHHPVGPVARAGGWLSIYYSIMQQQWNERSRGWFLSSVLPPPVSSHTWSLDHCPHHAFTVWPKQQTNNTYTLHINSSFLKKAWHYYHFVLIWIRRFYCLFWYLTFASLLHDMVSFIGATKAWAWLQWALHDTRDPGTGQRRESVQQLSSLTIKYNHQTRKSIPKICSCYNPK